MKRTLSLILSMLMVLSLFTGLSVSAQSVGDDAVTRVSDLADTGGDDTIYTSIDGQYYYQKLDDGTVCFNGLKTRDQTKRTWYSLPTMIDGYPVSELSSTSCHTVYTSNLFIPACYKQRIFWTEATFKNGYSHKVPDTIVYGRVTPSSQYQKDDLYYPLYEYHLKGDGTAVLDVIRPSWETPQVIPETLWDGTEISEIGYQAFRTIGSNTGYFLVVEIEHIFDSISQGFFNGFDGTSLRINVTGDTQISEGAFTGCNCRMTKGIILNVVGDRDIPTGFCTSDPGQKISVNVGGEIRQIKEDAFSHSRLYDITVNGNVETVGANAFSYTNAESLTLKNGVTTIGERAFYRCGLTEVTIPKSVTQIGNQAFGYIFDADYETAVKIDGFTIYGYRNTAAERYANENGFTFVPLDYIVFDASCTVTEPVAGQKPSYTATVPAGKGYQVEEDFTDGTWKNGVLWHNDTDNKDMTESDTFEAGKQYTATVLLELSDDNYSFISSVSGTMNSDYAKVINYGDGTIAVYRTFTCTATVISDFSVTNIIEPVAGQKPSYNAMIPDGNGYQISNTNNIVTKNGVGWYNMTDSTFLFPANNDPFEEGKEYGVFISLETTSSDYQFSDEPSATVNGKPADISAKGKNSITVFYVFSDSYILGDVDGDGKVDVFDASSIQKSIAGMSGYPNYNTMDKSDPKFRIADVDKDGKVDIFDASLIQKYIAGSASANGYGIGEVL